MAEIDLTTLSSRALLRTHGRLLRELRRREILRSSNNPTGDFGEYLFCEAFGWSQAPNSQKGFDALNEDGTRFQIKARRITPENPSRQLSAIRNLPNTPFDFLAGVIFDEDYEVLRAALIPHALIEPHARFAKHVNGHLLILRDTIWDLPDVRDVTERLRSVRF